MRKIAILAVLGLASLVLAATASAAPNHQTITFNEHLHGTFSDSQGFNPCTGNPMTFNLDGNTVQHATLFIDPSIDISGLTPDELFAVADNVWVTFTETGSMTASDTVNGQVG